MTTRNFSVLQAALLFGGGLWVIHQRKKKEQNRAQNIRRKIRVIEETTRRHQHNKLLVIFEIVFANKLADIQTLCQIAATSKELKKIAYNPFNAPKTLNLNASSNILAVHKTAANLVSQKRVYPSKIDRVLIKNEDKFINFHGDITESFPENTEFITTTKNKDGQMCGYGCSTRGKPSRPQIFGFLTKNCGFWATKILEASWFNEIIDKMITFYKENTSFAGGCEIYVSSPKKSFYFRVILNLWEDGDFACNNFSVICNALAYDNGIHLKAKALGFNKLSTPEDRVPILWNNGDDVFKWEEYIVALKTQKKEE